MFENDVPIDDSDYWDDTSVDTILEGEKEYIFIIIFLNFYLSSFSSLSALFFLFFLNKYSPKQAIMKIIQNNEV